VVHFDLGSSHEPEAAIYRYRKESRQMSQEPVTSVEGAAPGKALSPAAIRALEEAAARRQAQAQLDLPPAAEEGGPAGAEPTRYGDWERKGMAVDF
jgi:hypothetical protein